MSIVSSRIHLKNKYSNIQIVDRLLPFCEDRFEQFGAAGQAPKIKPVGLSSMAQFYL